MIAAKSQRRELVDHLWRQGFTASAIARHILRGLSSNEAPYYKALVGEVPNGTEAEQARYLVSAYINSDLGVIKRQHTQFIDASTANDALAEYIAREDRIYTQAWRDHDQAPEARDKIAALNIARASAIAKAKALGVSLENKVESNTNILNLGQLAVLASQQQNPLPPVQGTAAPAALDLSKVTYLPMPNIDTDTGAGAGAGAGDDDA